MPVIVHTRQRVGPGDSIPNRGVSRCPRWQGGRWTAPLPLQAGRGWVFRSEAAAQPPPRLAQRSTIMRHDDGSSQLDTARLRPAHDRVWHRGAAPPRAAAVDAHWLPL